jgi:hypothetical protein
MSMVMADDENSDFLANDAEEEVIREPPQIRSPDITLPDWKRFWLVRGLSHAITKLGVKLLCEPWSRNALVVAHYLVNPNRPSSSPYRSRPH